MKTRTRMWDRHPVGTEIDDWIAETPGDIFDIKFAIAGASNGATLVVCVMYDEYKYVVGKAEKDYNADQ